MASEKRATDLLTLIQDNYFSIAVPQPLAGLLAPVEDLLTGSLEGIAIDRPIFLVGAHRSGTTIISQVLCANKSLAYFSNASDILAEIPLLSNVIGQALDSQFGGRRFIDNVEESLSNPAEGIKMFEKFIEKPTVFYRMGADYENANLEAYLKVNIARHLKYFKGTRFINKNPYNSNRTPFLHKIFPTAKFVTLVRDPRAQVLSGVKGIVMAAEKYERWRDRAGIVHDLIEANQLEGYPSDLAQLPNLEFCAYVWRALQEINAKDRAQIGEEHFITLRFEDFLRDPQSWLTKFHQFCELPDDPTTMAQYDAKILGLDLSKAESWRKKLAPEEIALIQSIAGDWMNRYGYTPI